MKWPSFLKKDPYAEPSKNKPRTGRIRRWAKEFAIIACVVLAVQWWQSRGAVRGLAPALEVPGLDGAISLAATSGQATIVHFWATWCGVCQAEEGNIESVSRTRPVLTVASHSGDRSMLERYRAKRGVSFAVAPDPEGELAKAWGVKAYPTSFFIAPDGTVRSVAVGYTTTFGLKMRLWWASLFRA